MITIDYFFENPTNFACDNCPKNNKCDIAYSFGTDYSPCIIHRVIFNIIKDLHNKNRGGFLVTPSDSLNGETNLYKITLQFT